MNKWRQHQSELITICELMRYTPALNSIICSITPGGGKSSIPVILAHYLIPSRAERIAWITPRDNLRTQGETVFKDNNFRSLLGHKLEARATLPELDPCRGSIGFITTYQAVLADKVSRIFVEEFELHRYILVLDENQHCANGSEFQKSIQPLWDLAAVRVVMSGGLTRSDYDRVAFLPYLPPNNGGKALIDLSDMQERRIIRYSLRDALQERAIIPMWFELLDGNVSWEKAGTEFNAEKISEVDNGEIGSAIYTTLRTDFAYHLLTKTVEHWRAHRVHNQHSLLLVVAPSISLAQKYFRWLRQMGIEKCDIAVSDNTKMARDNIELYRKGGLHALVTVQMAYEGMDVPAITHIACLTHIRARPWIEQMLARATRYDKKSGPWEHQRAWIFAPDDQLFQEVMEEMKEIQAPFMQEARLGEGGNGKDRDPQVTTPISSAVDSSRGSGLDQDEQVSSDEHARMERALKDAGLYGIATSYQLKAAFESHARQQAGGFHTEEKETTEKSDEPISIREKNLRTKINKWINSNFYRGGDSVILEDINTAIIKRFGKSRTLMNERELIAVWDQRMEWSAPFRKKG